MQRLVATLAALSLANCVGKTIDVGSGMRGDAASSCVRPADVALASWPTADGCAAGNSLPLIGSWNGYVENFNGPPWDTLRLVVLGASEGTGLCGTLTIGTGAPPPPATDPNVGYPPGVEIVPFGQPLIVGYSYTLLEGSIQGSRVRFSIGLREVWREWCRLQSVCADKINPGQYACVPNGPAHASESGCVVTDPSSHEDQLFDCNKFHLCNIAGGACHCTESGCFAEPSPSMTFDLQLRDAELSGSGTSQGSPVRFYRSE
jgi:hypothetical protein